MPRVELLPVPRGGSADVRPSRRRGPAGRSGRFKRATDRGDQRVPSGLKAQDDVIDMPGKRPHLLSGLGIPDPDRAIVLGPRGDPPAVGTDGDRPDAGPMGRDRHQFGVALPLQIVPLPAPPAPAGTRRASAPARWGVLSFSSRSAKMIRFW